MPELQPLLGSFAAQDNPNTLLPQVFLCGLLKAALRTGYQARWSESRSLLILESSDGCAEVYIHSGYCRSPVDHRSLLRILRESLPGRPRSLAIYADSPDSCHGLVLGGPNFIWSPNLGVFFLAEANSVWQREVLVLGDSFEAFLVGLGARTRKNTRRCLREAERRSLSWSIFSSPSEAWVDIHDLAAQTYPFPVSSFALERLNLLLYQLGIPFWGLLRNGNGSLISLIAGFYAGDSAYVMLQLNHEDWLFLSPCLTARSCLVRDLISKSIKTVTFVGGANGALEHSMRSTWQQAFSLYVNILHPFVFSYLLRRGERYLVLIGKYCLRRSSGHLNTALAGIRKVWKSWRFSKRFRSVNSPYR